MNYKKGFTLIELLIVISIILLITSVVVAYVESARVKSENTSVKVNLNNARSEMNIAYSVNNDSFLNLCLNNTKLVAILREASLRGSGSYSSYVCNTTTNVWAISTPLKVSENGNSYWCIDSVGNNKAISANLGASVYQCP